MLNIMLPQDCPCSAFCADRCCLRRQAEPGRHWHRQCSELCQGAQPHLLLKLCRRRTRRGMQIGPLKRHMRCSRRPCCMQICCAGLSARRQAAIRGGAVLHKTRAQNVRRRPRQRRPPAAGTSRRPCSTTTYSRCICRQHRPPRAHPTHSALVCSRKPALWRPCRRHGNG